MKFTCHCGHEAPAGWVVGGRQLVCTEEHYMQLWFGSVVVGYLQGRFVAECVTYIMVYSCSGCAAEAKQRLTCRVLIYLLAGQWCRG